DVLRSRALPLLRGGPAPGRPLGAGRPVGGRTADVGAGVAGLPAPAGWHRRPTPVGEPSPAPYSVLRTRDAASRTLRPSPARAAEPASAALRRVTLTGAGPLPEMAPRPALLATPHVVAGRAGHLRRVPRPPGRRDEPGRRAAVGPLARPGRPRAARDGQRLLHGLSAPLAPDLGSPLAAGPLELAATAAHKMDRGAAACRVLLGLRSAGPVGPAVVDGLPRARLLRRRLRHRRPVPRRLLLQVPVPGRAVQLRAVAGFAAGGQGPRPGRLRLGPDPGLYPRPRRHPRV